MQQARNLRQGLRPLAGLALDAVLQRRRADALHHPALQKRLGGDPQIEVGIELTAQSLDVEQRLLQQHELRLDLDIEASRGLEQAHQHQPQRQLLQRPVEERLAAGAHRRLEFLDPRMTRHPSGLDVQFGHPAVVAPEEGEEVLRQVVLVELGQRADDAEVERDVAVEVGAFTTDQDVARMHVGMKEAMAEHLREEDLDAFARQLLQVDAGLAHLVHASDRNAVHALHRQHVHGAGTPVHLGHPQQTRVGEIAAQLIGVGALADQVELVVQVMVELVDHLQRPQPAGVGRHPGQQRAEGAQQRQVALDDVGHAGTQHLDRHRAAVVQTREVDLGDRRRGDRRGVELGIDLGDPAAEATLDLRDGVLPRKWRHPVLQQCELVGDVDGDQVAPGREHLAELDEDRPQAFERLAQSLTAGGVQLAAEPQQARERQ